MKRFILSLVVILGLISCETKSDSLNTSLVNNPSSADGIKKGTNTPAIKFEHLEHDFGKVLQGEQVSHTFKFKNVGDAPLIISSIEKTCGCTTPDFSSKPHKGFQNKRLIVKANTNPSETILRIKAQVENINTF